MDKKKFDPNFLHEIQSGSFPNNTPTHQIVIKISQESIETVFAYDRIKTTTKINHFNRRYHIPTELIDIFLSHIKQFNNRKAQQLEKDIKNILQSTNDYREQLALLKNHIWKLEQHKNHLLKDIDQDIITDYIQERIDAKILNQRIQTNQEQQLHTKTLTTGEKIRKFSPLLKDICDHIIHDIHINFKAIHKTKKTQDLTETTITIQPREQRLSKSQYGTSWAVDTKRSKRNKIDNIKYTQGKKIRNKRSQDDK